MKIKKVALYDPYLDVLGGGERYILSILKVLEDKGFQINIFWNKNISREIQNKLNLRFENLIFLPNIFQNSNFLKKTLFLKNFDIFLYVTNGSYFFSTAYKNFVYAMVPANKLYKSSIINKLKLLNYKFITHSQFIKNYLTQLNISSKLIYPLISDDYINLNIHTVKKDKIILSVGRFFEHLHSKRQDLMIKLFKKIQQIYPLFKDFKLILVGGLKDEDNQYLNKLKTLANNDPNIVLTTNISYMQLINLYKKSLLYWHFTGYGVDEDKHPEQVEHLGISPLEAMASGCITFCYKAGGPKELIDDGNTGFLFLNEDDLFKKIINVLNNNSLQLEIRNNAKNYIKKNFSYEIFKQNVIKVFDL